MIIILSLIPFETYINKNYKNNNVNPIEFISFLDALIRLLFEWILGPNFSSFLHIIILALPTYSLRSSQPSPLAPIQLSI